MTTTVRPTVLIVGASRGLGHAMAAEFLRRKKPAHMAFYDK